MLSFWTCMLLFFIAKIIINRKKHSKQKSEGLPATSVGIFVATEIWSRLKLALMQQRQQLGHLLWKKKNDLLLLHFTHFSKT